MTKVNVELTFPMGAHFYQNVYISVYRQLTQFIYSLNCISHTSKCYECSFASSCRYFHCTGENFNKYPRILIHNPLFPKSIYTKNENIIFEFYLIGENKQYIDYIKLFFESYLEQSLNRNYYYLKDIIISNTNSDNRGVRHIQLKSCVESTQILDVYNQMIEYYNENYNCNFDIIQSDYQIHHQKYVSFGIISLKTKRVNFEGDIYDVYFEENINVNQCFFEIGIGKFNYIGGGYIAIEDNS